MRPPIPRFSRRTFVESVAGALLAAASVPYPGLARLLEQTGERSQADEDVDAGFWSGVVTAKDARSLVLTSLEGSRRVLVEPGLTVWKEFAVSIDGVALGDQVMARGEPQADGSLAAWPGWVWVNIGQWHGSIVATHPDGIVVRRRDGVQREVQFSPRVQVIRAKKQIPIREGTAALVVGMEVGSVGLGISGQQRLRATRIWIY